MSSEDIYKPNDFYRIKNHKILKDGHTMLAQNIENDLNNYRRGYLKLQAEKKQLEAENNRLRAALEVYANTDNWSISYWDNCEVFRYRFDEAKGSIVGEVGGDGEWTLTNGYKIAQEALKGE